MAKKLVEKVRAMRAKLAVVGNNEPKLVQESYTESLMRVLNYYNQNHENSEKKKWFVSHYGKEIKGLADVSDSEFRSAGTLCRILDNGNVLDTKHTNFLAKEFKRLTVSKAKKEKVVGTGPAKPGIQEKMNDKASEFLGEFCGLVDGFVVTNVVPDVSALIASMNIRGPVAKKVLARASNTVQELTEALTSKDPQMVEGYSNFTKPRLKKLIGIYDQLATALDQAKKMSPKKPRKIKAKPAGTVVKSVKFKAEDTELKLKSVSPTNLVGASEAWLYNVKYNKLAVYEAVSGEVLTVKGSTLVNFDAEKSECKRVKKPATLSALVPNGKRAFSKYMKDMKSKAGPVTGRLGSEWIILKTFGV